MNNEGIKFNNEKFNKYTLELTNYFNNAIIEDKYMEEYPIKKFDDVLSLLDNLYDSILNLISEKTRKSKNVYIFKEYFEDDDITYSNLSKTYNVSENMIYQRITIVYRKFVSFFSKNEFSKNIDNILNLLIDIHYEDFYGFVKYCCFIDSIRKTKFLLSFFFSNEFISLVFSRIEGE